MQLERAMNGRWLAHGAKDPERENIQQTNAEEKNLATIYRQLCGLMPKDLISGRMTTEILGNYRGTFSEIATFFNGVVVGVEFAEQAGKDAHLHFWELIKLAFESRKKLRKLSAEWHSLFEQRRNRKG